MVDEKEKDKIQAELSALVDDVVRLARSSAGLDTGRVEELKRKFRERVADVQAEAQDKARELMDQAGVTVERADALAHEKPWHFAVAAGLMGLAIGVLVSRR